MTDTTTTEATTTEAAPSPVSAALAEERATAVRAYLGSLQDELCSVFGGPAGLDGREEFKRDRWQRGGEGGALAGDGVTAVLEEGGVFERAGVALSDVRGNKLPPSATARNPQLAGRSFRAMGVSVVMHPRNPQAPTSHMNVRFFSAGDVWWFGGGFDLTPYIVHADDGRLWHQAAADACTPFHPGLYAHARQTCDEYFILKHRGESRGLGGIFYDDLNEGTATFGMPWERCFEFMRAVGAGYVSAYRQVIARRHALPSDERQRRYQLYRRGRYVEFNLVFDRGTLFGLQSGGRTDAILMSMPPLANWSYRSPDEELDAQLLPWLTSRRGHDWLGAGAT
jgi:coproporphyrinogen III oxidase